MITGDNSENLNAAEKSYKLLKLGKNVEKNLHFIKINYNFDQLVKLYS